MVKGVPSVRGVLTFPKRDKFDRVKALASQQPLRTFFNRKVQIGPHIPCIALKVWSRSIHLQWLSCPYYLSAHQDRKHSEKPPSLRQRNVVQLLTDRVTTQFETKAAGLVECAECTLNTAITFFKASKRFFKFFGIQKKLFLHMMHTGFRRSELICIDRIFIPTYRGCRPLVFSSDQTW